MKKINIRGLDHIDSAAKEFLLYVKDYSVIAFYGSMGAGKTTFITSLCKVMGVEDQVNSPTFTIVNEYRTLQNKPIFHFDFYRIDNIQEVIDLGFDEYVYSDGVCLMEWPERIEAILPEDVLKVEIVELEDGTREIRLLNYPEIK